MIGCDRVTRPWLPGTLNWDLQAAPASSDMLKRDRSPSDARQRERARARSADIEDHPYATDIFNFEQRLFDLDRLRRSHEIRLVAERERIAPDCTHRHHGNGFEESFNPEGTRRLRRCALCRKWEVCDTVSDQQLPPNIAEQRGVRHYLGISRTPASPYLSDAYDADLRSHWLQGHPWQRVVKVEGHEHRTSRETAPPMDHRRAAGIEPPNTP